MLPDQRVGTIPISINRAAGLTSKGERWSETDGAATVVDLSAMGLESTSLEMRRDQRLLSRRLYCPAIRIGIVPWLWSL